MALMVIDVEIAVRSMPSNSRCMSFDRIDGHFDFANFSHGQRIVRIEANLCWQIKGH